MARARIAILGSGNIGTDLLIKVMRSPSLACTAFVGRSPNSQGMAKARSLSINVSDGGIDYLTDNPGLYDVVFDATSASSHLEHAPLFEQLGKIAIDLTPARVGPMCVPAVNMDACLSAINVNMVTCGGQASIPVMHAIGQTQQDIDYMEVVSSIASRSAGPATRLNLDEYIHTTEEGAKYFSGARRCKAILNLNPAVPCINMQTTIFAKVAEPSLDALKPVLHAMIAKIRGYVPGYELVVGPLVENNRIVVTIRVRGLGDYLPEYAGNLDIINCGSGSNSRSVRQPTHVLRRPS